MVLDAGQPHLKKTRRLSPSFFNFVYRGTHFCAMVAADRTTTETTQSGADNGKRPGPPTHRRDGSGIPPFSAITFQLRHRVHSGHHICLLLLSSSLPAVFPPCLSLLPVVGNRSDMVVAAKYTVASGHACVGCVLWRSETAFGGSPSLPSILLSETPLVIG